MDIFKKYIAVVKQIKDWFIVFYIFSDNNHLGQEGEHRIDEKVLLLVFHLSVDLCILSILFSIGS